MSLRYVAMVWYLLSLLSLITVDTLAQSACADRLTFTPVSVPNQINWANFPDFTVPFPVIYGGPRFTDSQASPLRHGFSHLVSAKDSEVGSLVTARQRAHVYYGFATDINQPWETVFSPWNNDLNAYRAKWDRYLSSLASGQKNAAGQYVIPFSRFVLDIERILPSDTRILALKQNTAIPNTYRQLSDADFLTAYKTAIRNLYAEGITYVRQHTDLTNTSVTSYADTPILNTYLNVIGNSWTDWTTNLNRVNYLVKESESSGVGGPYYNQLDALSPSAYYYYDYPNPLARDYLPYLLFQVEANRAWSNKPVVPWVWMRYHDSSSSYPNFIQPFMAEATAIFPFFSGASGLWLWENPSFEQTRTDVYAAYEHFTHGLYRLSRFADMFQGTYELVIETPARDLMDKQLPVWRGVVKEDKILIAAQNSYATSDNQKTNLTVRYKSWQRTIELTGREVYLCQFDMSAITANEPIFSSVNVSPNPASAELTVTFPQLPNTPTELELLTMQGQVVARKTVAQLREVMGTAQLPAGLYILKIRNARGSHTQRVLLTR